MPQDLLMLIILVALIVRGVCFEFRSLLRKVEFHFLA